MDIVAMTHKASEMRKSHKLYICERAAECGISESCHCGKPHYAIPACIRPCKRSILCGGAVCKQNK